MRLLVRKQCWTLSGPAKLVLVAGLVLATWFASKAVYPFLATTARVPADVLVVEGWVQEYAIHAAVEELNRGHYARVLTTGGPVEGAGPYTNDYNTSASVGAARLRKAGVPADRVTLVPARFVGRDRTYASAVALHAWLQANAPEVRRVNVLTADAHARRTRLLFQQALGPKYAVGVIAVPSPDYDADHWWRYSEGVRTVLGEALSYVYAKLLFIPDSHLDPNPSNPHLHEHYVESSH